MHYFKGLSVAKNCLKPIFYLFYGFKNHSTYFLLNPMSLLSCVWNIILLNIFQTLITLTNKSLYLSQAYMYKLWFFHLKIKYISHCQFSTPENSYKKFRFSLKSEPNLVQSLIANWVSHISLKWMFLKYMVHALVF